VRMKPDWDRLVAEFSNSPDRLLADVDCTAGGKTLCTKVGIRSYPTLKYGDPHNMQDYKGDRSYAALKAFADGLEPQCGPAHLEACDEAQRQQIAEFSAMGEFDREALIMVEDNEIAALENDIIILGDETREDIAEASQKKDAEIEAIRSSGLSLLKAVQAFESRGKAEL